MLGNLGRDPEVRFTQGGTPVANFTMATTDRWSDPSGEKKEKTEWHRIVVWGRTAENCGQYLDKGRSVYIEGRLQTREYEKDGIKRYTTEIVGEKMQMLSGKGEGGAGNHGTGKPGGGGSGGHCEEPLFNPDDDIPFSRGPGIYDARV